jgi:nucleoside phosphorylase
VCALAVEERAARRGGARTARIGGPLPEGPLVSFGVCGALVDGLASGALVAARRVVDEAGETLWEGEPLAVAGARAVVVCAAARIVDTAEERAALAARCGADVADLESGRLAATGRLVGVVRAVSDTPGTPLGRLAASATPAGGTSHAAAARAFVLAPRASLRAARSARRALAALEPAARALAAR